MTSSEQKDFGRRVAFLRKRRGYSQVELARKVGRSETWVSQIERGVRKLDRVSVIKAVAAALDVSVDELGSGRSSTSLQAGTVAPASILALTLASNSALRALVEAPEPADLDDVVDRAAQVWQHTHAAQYEDTAELLIELVADIEALVRQSADEDRKRALAAKSRIYLAAAGALSKLGEGGAAWVAIDRAASAGEELGDPLVMAECAFRLAIAFQSAKRFDMARQVAGTAAETITDIANSDSAAAPAIAIFGALNLQLAVASARCGEAGEAYQFLNIARSAAERIGDGRNDFNTEFGPANVNNHEVSVAVALGDAGRALRVAEHALTAHLSSERRGRLLIDIAAANAQLRRTATTVAALSEAADVAPEQFAAHDRARELVVDLVREHGFDPEVKALAKRVRQ